MSRTCSVRLKLGEHTDTSLYCIVPFLTLFSGNRNVWCLALSSAKNILERMRTTWIFSISSAPIGVPDNMQVYIHIAADYCLDNQVIFLQSTGIILNTSFVPCQNISVFTLQIESRVVREKHLTPLPVVSSLSSLKNTICEIKKTYISIGLSAKRPTWWSTTISFIALFGLSHSDVLTKEIFDSEIVLCVLFWRNVNNRH